MPEEKHSIFEKPGETAYEETKRTEAKRVESQREAKSEAKHPDSHRVVPAPAPPKDQVLRPSDGVPEHLMGVSLDDVFRYGRIVSAVISAIKTFKSLALGVSEKPGLVQFEVDGKNYDWELGTITRTK